MGKHLWGKMTMSELIQVDMLEEMKRRKSKRDDLLAAFERFGTLDTGQIMEIAGTGMSSRLKELKRKGHRIAPRYERPGCWSYTYLGFNGEDE